MPARRRPGERLLAGIRVLIVDDDDGLRDATRELLEKQGAEVTAVGSAAAALAALERSKPHVLLSELAIPGGSGDELVRKAMAHDASLPALALTTLPTEEDRRRALAAGVRIHLAKPLDAEALVRAVAGLAGGASRRA
jgi:CheY-like chemotaxis protein